MEEDKDLQEYLEKSVAIDPDTINNEFCRVPGDLAYWGQQMAVSLEEWKRAKLNRERTEAELFMRQREILISSGVKRPTVSDIESAVQLNPDYEDVKLVEIEAEARYIHMKNNFVAVLAKKEMLQSLGANLRAELERDPVTRDTMASARQARRDDW